MERNTTSDPRSFSQLLADLKQETAGLVREEVALAKAELSEKAGRVRGGATFLGIGGVLAVGGFLVLLQASVLVLDLAIGRLWLSSTIVGLLVVIFGAIFLGAGARRLRPDRLSPDQTAESLRRDKEIVEKHVGTAHG